MTRDDLLHAAYEQIITACDLGDVSREAWLDAYRDFRKVAWVDHEGQKFMPPPPTAAMRLAGAADFELIAELERRALSRLGHKPKPLILLRDEGVLADTIVCDTE